MRLFLFLLFICPSAFAAYSEMIIEGVKQSNGVWTAAGVMDTQGFVRTTGAVTVAGATRNLPVSFAADVSASSKILRGAGRALGPVSLALVAYDVYEAFQDEGVEACGENWCTGVDDSIHAPPGVSGSCRVYDYLLQGRIYPGYTAESCIADNIAAITALPYGVYAEFLGWTSVTTTSVQIEYSGIFRLKNKSNGSFNSDLIASWYGPLSATPVPAGTPATDDDFNRMPDFAPSVLSNGFNGIPSLQDSPIPIKGDSTSFVPFSEWLSDPYFKDGSWYRDRMDVSPCPTSSQPTRVCIDIGPQKFEGATDPQTIPSQATGTATGTTPKEKPSFCKENPQSIACAELGDLEDEELTLDERPFHITPESPWGQGSASCPNPETETLRTGATVTFSYQPTCDFFSSIRPAVIAVAFLAALYIALGIPAGKGV